MDDLKPKKVDKVKGGDATPIEANRFKNLTFRMP
jgi:hypothetical protein